MADRTARPGFGPGGKIFPFRGVPISAPPADAVVRQWRRVEEGEEERGGGRVRWNAALGGAEWVGSRRRGVVEETEEGRAQRVRGFVVGPDWVGSKKGRAQEDEEFITQRRIWSAALVPAVVVTAYVPLVVRRRVIEEEEERIGQRRNWFSELSVLWVPQFRKSTFDQSEEDGPQRRRSGVASFVPPLVVAYVPMVRRPRVVEEEEEQRGRKSGFAAFGDGWIPVNRAKGKVEEGEEGSIQRRTSVGPIVQSPMPFMRRTLVDVVDDIPLQRFRGIAALVPPVVTGNAYVPVRRTSGVWEVEEWVIGKGRSGVATFAPSGPGPSPVPVSPNTSGWDPWPYDVDRDERENERKVRFAARLRGAILDGIEKEWDRPLVAHYNFAADVPRSSKVKTLLLLKVAERRNVGVLKSDAVWAKGEGTLVKVGSRSVAERRRVVALAKEMGFGVVAVTGRSGLLKIEEENEVDGTLVILGVGIGLGIALMKKGK